MYDKNNYTYLYKKKMHWRDNFSSQRRICSADEKEWNALSSEREENFFFLLRFLLLFRLILVIASKWVARIILCTEEQPSKDLKQLKQLWTAK